jgi:hypothetical protein
LSRQFLFLGKIQVLKKINLEKNLRDFGARFLQVWKTKLTMIPNNQKRFPEK